ncbi:MAG: GNAT family N-acetyltransferase [Candidatus Bathyarchaeia archaeon]|jgi:ribosomal protein S18 acetylase RimI-like enzyme
MIQVLEFANEHLQAVVRLLNDEYRGSYEFVPFNEERVMSQIRRRGIRILVAEENGSVLGLIGTHPEERSEENISWLAARKGSDRRTVENMLVNAVERKAEGDTVITTVDEGSLRINDWINRGYDLNPGWLRMSAKLDRLKPVSKIAEGIKIRSLRVGEEGKLVEAMNTGFGWRRLELGAVESWKFEDPPFREDWVQVAETGERIVSAVVARPDTDYNKYLHLKRGYLGPATTLPEFRNKHLASALTAQAMNFLFEKGMNSVRLGTSEENISSITLLRTLGFQVDNIRKIMRKKLKNG